jgi:hypothetical protein
MVLLKRPDYRAALEGVLEFRRRWLVRLDEPAVETPLENLPFLYQTWGALEAIALLLELAADAGYVLRHQELVTRRTGELWVRLVRNGRPAAVLAHHGSDSMMGIVRRGYSASSAALARCASRGTFPQDLAMRPAREPVGT